MVSRPSWVAMGLRFGKWKLMSRHHFEVATWVAARARSRHRLASRRSRNRAELIGCRDIIFEVATWVASWEVAT